MATTLADIHVKVDRNIKTESEEVLRKIGISFSDLFNMTLRRVIYERRIPFDTRVSRTDLPENMRVESRADLEALLEKSIKNDTGERYNIDQIQSAILHRKEELTA